ncbi:MAG: phosphatase PAP2-related protein [Casimicrobiaceae bacterium]
MPPLETIGLRVLAIAAGVVVWFLTQKMIGARSIADGALYDHLHVVTAGWNRWLHDHPKAANAILIASSLGVDVVTLFVLALAVFGPSFMPFWGLLALFLLRQLSQAAVALPPPPGIIWRDPGFPSLFVTYGIGNDFFFSGHTALAVYGAMQLAALHIPALTVAGIVVATLQIVAVIALRAHWTMDVIAGLAAALAVGLCVR